MYFAALGIKCTPFCIEYGLWGANSTTVQVDNCEGNYTFGH